MMCVVSVVVGHVKYVIATTITVITCFSKITRKPIFPTAAAVRKNLISNGTSACNLFLQLHLSASRNGWNQHHCQFCSVDYATPCCTQAAQPNPATLEVHSDSFVLYTRVTILEVVCRCTPAASQSRAIVMLGSSFQALDCPITWIPTPLLLLLLPRSSPCTWKKPRRCAQKATS